MRISAAFTVMRYSQVVGLGHHNEIDRVLCTPRQKRPEPLRQRREDCPLFSSGHRA
jgi:hypothetical protein